MTAFFEQLLPLNVFCPGQFVLSSRTFFEIKNVVLLAVNTLIVIFCFYTIFSMSLKLYISMALISVD